MHLSMISRAKAGNFGNISTCLIMAALLATPILRAQEQDRNQLRLQAMAMEQKGQNSEAEEIWAALVKADAGDAEALAHLGLLSARQEHYIDAIDYYRRAIAINS